MYSHVAFEIDIQKPLPTTYIPTQAHTNNKATPTNTYRARLSRAVSRRNIATDQKEPLPSIVRAVHFPEYLRDTCGFFCQRACIGIAG